MKKIMFRLKIFAEWFVEWFVFINTGILIICAVNFSSEEAIPKDTLWEILLSALLTAAVTAVVFMIEPIKKSSAFLCFLLHFGSLTVIMIVCGLRFGWIAFAPIEMFYMGIWVAFVYVFVMIVYYVLDKHRAEQMNRRLREKYKDEEEEDTL